MKDRDTTARSRELGEELRRVRERAGYNGSELARKLGWSPSRVSRLESGTRGTSEVDLAVLLAVCNVTGAELERLLELAREAFASTWLQPHGDRISDQLRTLAMHEATATAIFGYEPMVVPGLLQTENYTQALFRWAGLVPTDQINPLVQTRMARQSLLRRRQPPKVCFYIHEHALFAPPGNFRIMNEQLLHLALVAARPQCTIRVISKHAGLHGALGDRFRIMKFRDHRPMAYVETSISSLFLEKPHDIAAYQAILNRLAEVALDEGQSRERLVRLANDYDEREDKYEFP
jgi:transcriptional regulator with XRE-family HTH domain